MTDLKLEIKSDSFEGIESCHDTKKIALDSTGADKLTTALKNLISHTGIFAVYAVNMLVVTKLLHKRRVP